MKNVKTEEVARQMPLQSPIYKLKKGLPLQAHDSRKPLYQAVYAPSPIGNRARTAYLHCIKDGKKIDPACGSGHMLVYAFDILFTIYEEEGYDAADIPTKILTHNLYGIEIDERAGELAAFALAMKARSKQRLFLKKQIRPNICVLENVKFDSSDLKEYMNFIGRDIFTLQLQNTLCQFEEADNFGSLIRPDLTDVEPMIQFLNSKNVGSDLFLNKTHAKVLKVLSQTEYLRSKYHVVVANPPYMGGNGMNDALKHYLREHYKDSKNDLYAAFIAKTLELTLSHGYSALISMQSWMFLSRFELLRTFLISNFKILTLAHLGTRAFDSIGGEVVSTACYCMQKSSLKSYSGSFDRLVDLSANDKSNALKSGLRRNIVRVNAFLDIPGSPIAYWVSDNVRRHFKISPLLGNIVDTAVGLFTCDNERFLRHWHEVSMKKASYDSKNREKAEESGRKYFPIQKGGGDIKWYGLNYLLCQFDNDGKAIRDHRQKSGQSYTLPGEELYFRDGITWSGLTSKANSFRWVDFGYLFESNKGQMLFCNNKHTILGLLNSKVTELYLQLLNPTLSIQSSDIKNMPIVLPRDESKLINIVENIVSIYRRDWDSHETSWDFKASVLIKIADEMENIESIYNNIRASWQKTVSRAHRLEEENNQIFIEAYGFQEEMSSEVSIFDITLTCNPYYQYGVNKSEAELEAMLLADTIREFISYSVGCMFGRYSVDKPGLVLANQAETIADYFKQIPSPTFTADEDNVIPILDGDWFADDVVERFRQFLRVTLGDDHFQENLQFIESAIGKDIRSFFLKDFYSDHIKRYKKRPIYWLFSSPKGTFNALIYMHRYRPDTVSVVLNKYLREFKVKLSARMEYLNRIEVSTNASKSEKTRAIKERETLKKNLDELDVWERDVLYPLALEQKEIDLDDGVKVNYPKFGAALKKIPGLDAEED